jgi:regulatory associated protein of mTOR
MTAVAVQQNAHPPQYSQPRQPSTPTPKSSSYQARHQPLGSSSHPSTAEGTAPVIAHGSASIMPPTSEPNGSTTNEAPPRRNSAAPHHGSEHDSHTSSNRRPSSAPGNKNGLSITALHNDDDTESDRPKRAVKPLLLRSRSEHGLRPGDETEHTDEEIYDWGARHGFEDHYQSEDIISQLANVSQLFC